MILKTHRKNTVHEYFNKVKYVTSEYQKINDIDKNWLKEVFKKKKKNYLRIHSILYITDLLVRISG
jgi:hypothetical protein